MNTSRNFCNMSLKELKDICRGEPQKYRGFSSLKKAPSLNEAQVDDGLRKIRQALLEADVALPVAKELIKKIKPKAIGQEIIKSTTPGQMIVKVVFDEIVKILGDTKSELNLNAVPPVCLMLVNALADHVADGSANRIALPEIVVSPFRAVQQFAS